MSDHKRMPDRVNTTRQTYLEVMHKLTKRSLELKRQETKPQ